jgi:hypothetical protein
MHILRCIDKIVIYINFNLQVEFNKFSISLSLYN